MGEKLLTAIWFLAIGVLVLTIPSGEADRIAGVGCVWSIITAILAWSLWGTKGERL
jgi:hypothetical protein